MKTAIVIGNGMVGACTALALQRQGLQVTIIDSGDEKAAASFGNAGHLATEQCDPLASRANVLSLHRRLFSRGGPVGFPLRDISAWLPFGFKLLAAASPQRFARGQAAMTQLLQDAIPAWQRTAQAAGATPLIRADGHFVVWESAASAARGMANLQRANLGTARVRAANADELAALRVRFAGTPVGAARFGNTGQVLDLPAMRQALARAFAVAGGVVRRAQVRTVGDSVTLDDGATLTADCIVVAAGIGSADVLRSTFGAIPLIAERGYHVEVRMDGRAATSEGLPVVFEDRSTIIAPFASSLRISGFTEFSRVSSPPDPRKWSALERHAAEIGLFSPKEKIERWVGARPTLPDYLPAIGRSATHPHVFYAFGHNHLGITLAAITGEIVAALVGAQRSSADLSPFSLDRFT